MPIANCRSAESPPLKDAAGDELKLALTQANIPTLLLTLAHVTGADRWLQDPFRPVRSKGLGDNDTGGLSPDLQETVRDAAYQMVMDYRRGLLTVAELTPDSVAQMLGVALGEPIDPAYGVLLAEELGVCSRDVAVHTPPDDFHVIIIGSGLSGMCAAIKLAQQGISFTIIEKNPTVGGAWLENTYPGCGVDTPSHLYSYSFDQNPSWSRYFAKRPELSAYLEAIADKYHLRQHVRFNTEVESAHFDESDGGWVVTARNQSGILEKLDANVVISAVGILNRPSIPKIPGLDSYSGPSMHTAQWREDVDLTGKVVAVIGTGASAMQLVPSIAGTAAKTLIFQRSPQWAVPHPNYQLPVTAGVQKLMREVPFYEGWYRLRQFWNFSDRLHASLQIDPDWPHFDRSINEANESHRRFLTSYITSELGDRQDLLDKVLPTYPPYGKRPLIDNGWFRAVQRDDVEIITESVAEVRPHSVVTVDGQEFEADVVVLATGFQSLRILGPMEIRGRSEASLREIWGEDDAHAYLGITIPDLPNFFCINGPNTTAGHGGSAVVNTELQVRYVLQLIDHLIKSGSTTVECRQDVHDDYNDELDAALSRTIWTHPGMTTYYRNSRGRIVTNSPWTYLDYWNRTRFADPRDYLWDGEPAHARLESPDGDAGSDRSPPTSRAEATEENLSLTHDPSMQMKVL